MIHKSNKKNEFELIIYSDTGKNHISANIANQDSALYGSVSGDCCFLAVADGVSSVKYGKEGSLAAVQSVRWLAERIDTGSIDIANMDRIRTSFVKNWKSRFEEDWDDYASTINFIIVKACSLLVGQIGDGLVVVDTGNGKHIYGESADFYSSETYALGRAVIKSSFVLEVLPIMGKVTAVMMSDGIGKEIKPDSREELLKYISELVVTENAKKEIEEWILELSKRNGDDKTIGIMIGRD